MVFQEQGSDLLLAVAAFMIGVIITAVIIGIRKRQQDRKEADLKYKRA
jgi:hypothetical protein